MNPYTNLRGIKKIKYAGDIYFRGSLLYRTSCRLTDRTLKMSVKMTFCTLRESIPSTYQICNITLLNFITCLVIFPAVKRYIGTPTPTCFTIFVILILIAPIKPHYNMLNNSEWLSWLTVSGGGKKEQYNAGSFEIIRFLPTYFFDITAYIYIYIWTLI
jgi:hypothetical protein